MAIPFHYQKSIAAVFLAATPPLLAAESASGAPRTVLLDLAVDTFGGRLVVIWKTPLFTLSDPVYVNGQLLQRASSVTLGMLTTTLAILLAGGIFPPP